MKRNAKVIVGIVLTAALLTTMLLIREGLSLGKHSSVTRMYGGADGLRTVTQPTKVEAFRLKPNFKYDDTAFTDPNNNYDVIAGPVSVPENIVNELGTSLVSTQSYEWDIAKGCMPQFGVRLSFQRESDQMDVYLCLDCQILSVMRNGSVTGGGNFDPMNATLVRVAKSLFPNDPEIK